MFALVVRFDLTDQSAASKFDALVERTAAGIVEHEPGTLVYSTHPVVDEPLARVFYEVYADRAAFEAHEEQPHVKAFLAERGQYLSATRVEFLSDGPAKGLPAGPGDE
ncbi:putative quinol monooxygenase [Kribbella sp. NBC_00889]|jgi:quinol monooxygenase YgiN|uniref:putative quinol monooxygenase n=1 Tax=Kribbella sp. NBC_00889 TaxID=2975974 RepID=UPI0038676FA2|nr:antibiotic biosynthesis monooxygenase [Kribbella sp. NBC_00889]